MRTIRIPFAATAVLAGAAVFFGIGSLSAAAAGWQVIYSQDFSADPVEWVTNNSARYYWRDAPDEDYYQEHVNKSGDFAYAPVTYADNGPFKLEFDCNVMSLDYGSEVILGLWDPDMVRSGPSGIDIYYCRGDGGKLVGVSWRHDGDSGGNREYPSDWQYDTWYHNSLEYDPVSGTLEFWVTEGKGGGGALVAHVTDTGVHLADNLCRLGMTGISDWGVMGITGVGQIDNISLSIPEPATLALLAVGGLLLIRRRAR